MSDSKYIIGPEKPQLEIIENNLLLPEYGEAMLYHDAGKFGFVKIAIEDKGGRKEEGFPVSELADRIKYLPKHRDSYLTQSEFKGPQKVINKFLRTQVCFLDLDVYNIHVHQRKSAEELCQALLIACSETGTPTPSLIVFSGRGLYPKWILDYPIPYGALPKWNRVQKELFTRLKDFGPDKTKINAGSILRIENTVNTKSGEIARVLWVNEDRGKIARWDFDTLADEVLPFTVEQLKETRRKLTEARKKKAIVTPDYDQEALKRDIAEANSHTRRFNVEHRALGCLTDLKIIARALYGPYGVPEGERDKFIYTAAIFAAQITKDPAQYWRELTTMHQELTPSLSWAQVQSYTSTVYQNMMKGLQGKKVLYNGRLRSARYGMKNQTLIELLKVTPEIERQTVTIISRGERRRRQRAYAERVRRGQGAVEREVYELQRQGAKKANIDRARALRADGKTLKQIGAEMGVNISTVKRYVRGV